MESIWLSVMRQIMSKDKKASNVEQDMLTTLEVCYEFYLRGVLLRADGSL